jgi:hypothetical protein
MSKPRRECDGQENARIAAADCFQEADRARKSGDTRRAATLEAQGKQTAKWGGGRRS